MGIEESVSLAAALVFSASSCVANLGCQVSSPNIAFSKTLQTPD
jgi:hypothetical protein